MCLKITWKVSFYNLAKSFGFLLKILIIFGVKIQMLYIFRWLSIVQQLWIVLATWKSSKRRRIVYALQPDWRKHEINNEILSQNPAGGLQAGFEKSHKSINQAATSMIWDMEINYYFLLKGKQQLWRI